MSNAILEGLVKEKDYAFKKHIFKIVRDFNLTVYELQLVIYFLNQEPIVFDIGEIKNITFMDEKQIIEAFSSLTAKSLINIDVIKQKDGKVSEIIDVSNVYKAMVSEINTNIKEQVSTNIFSIFEKEFGRTLGPMEYEIINAWLKAGTSEEIIVGALKEAVFNGVNSLKYIDKIIYEWGKKGFKTMTDVDNHLKNRTKEEPKDLFDYNWLDDE